VGMFTHTEMVLLGDSFLQYGQTASILVMWFLSIPCAVFLGAKWAQPWASCGANWGMAGE